MNKMKLLTQIKTFAFFFTWVISGGMNSPRLVLAQSTQPANRSLFSGGIDFKVGSISGTGNPKPVKRKDSGSSGPCETAHIKGDEFLTALVPKYDVHALTVDPYPTLWFHIPYDSFHSMKFELEDENNQTVYENKRIRTNGLKGLVSFQLPQEKASLKINKKYKWKFVVYCQNPQQTTSTVKFIVKGNIIRVPINDKLKLGLGRQVPPRRKAALYARYGMWFDALNILGNLYRTNPKNQQLAADWADLLEDVELKDIASKPITNCCNSPSKRLSTVKSAL